MDNLNLYNFLIEKHIPKYICINVLLVKNRIINTFLISWKYYNNYPTLPILLDYLEIITFKINNLKVCKFKEFNGYLVGLNTTIDQKCNTFNNCIINNIFNYPHNYKEINFGN